MGVYRGLDTEEGWIQRRFAELEKALDEERAARRLGVKTDTVQQILTGQNLTTNLSRYITRTFTAPDGYTFALVQVTVSAFTSTAGSFSDTTKNGWLEVLPYVNGVPGFVLSQARIGAGPISVNAAHTVRIPVSGSFDIGVDAASYGTASNSGSGQVSIAATVLYTRG